MLEIIAFVDSQATPSVLGKTVSLTFESSESHVYADRLSKHLEDNRRYQDLSCFV